MSKQATPFDFIETNTVATSESRQLEHTNQLIALGKAKGAAVMNFIAKQAPADKTASIEAIKAGKAEGLMNLINQVTPAEDLEKDAEFMAGNSDNVFSRLLESRRSDRSKTLAKGPLKDVQTCQAFIGAMYSEMLVRKAWNKPYLATNTSSIVDENDLEAIGRKIKSLQTKKCRLQKTAKYEPEDQKMLDEVNAEIARLNEFRPTVTGKTVIRSTDAETIRTALKLLDLNSLDADTRAKLEKANLI